MASPWLSVSPILPISEVAHGDGGLSVRSPISTSTYLSLIYLSLSVEVVTRILVRHVVHRPTWVKWFSTCGYILGEGVETPSILINTPSITQWYFFLFLLFFLRCFFHCLVLFIHTVSFPWLTYFPKLIYLIPHSLMTLRLLWLLFSYFYFRDRK